MDDKEKSLKFPELLFFGEGSRIGLVNHTHSFYQLEVCTAGKLLGIGSSQTHLMRPGQYWLIPPETPHRFASYSPDLSYFSLKFNSPFPVPESFDHDDFTRYQIKLLGQLLEPNAAYSPYSDAGRQMIEAQLFLLLDHLAFKQLPGLSPVSSFLMRLREEISNFGYKINVNELVEYFKCTRGQFRYRFAQESGGQTSIKTFVDETLFEIAQNHLKFSDKNFTRIADEMNFPSLSVFSRFIKRMSGLNPNELRRKIRSTQK